MYQYYVWYAFAGRQTVCCLLWQGVRLCAVALWQGVKLCVVTLWQARTVCIMLWDCVWCAVVGYVRLCVVC